MKRILLKIIPLSFIGGLIFAFQNFATVTLPASSTRPFLMGFTTWPKNTLEDGSGTIETQQFVQAHGDIVAFHLDNGVPWTEAWSDLPVSGYPETVRRDWDMAKSDWLNKLKPDPTKPRNKKVYLALTPLGVDRENLAYYGDPSDLNYDLNYWNSFLLSPKGFANKNLVNAYTNYVEQAIAWFEPDYLNIGIEANILLTKNPTRWNQFRAFYLKVYKKLKAKHPNLQIFISVATDHYLALQYSSEVDRVNFHNKQYRKLKTLSEQLDLICLSLYPYGFNYPDNPDPNTDSFKIELGDIATLGKPLAVCESGMPSKSFSVNEGGHIRQYTFTENSQKEYLKDLFTQAQNNNMKFIINWTAFDFDAMEGIDESIWGAYFKFTGLKQSDNTSKLGLRVWQKQFEIPYK